MATARPLPTATYTDDGQPILFYVKALEDYTPTTVDEFVVLTGDIIAVTHAPEDGWWTGELVDDPWRTVSTIRGVFPSDLVFEVTPRMPPLPLTRLCTDDGRVILFYVKAVYDHHAILEDELDFRTGDIIAVTDAPKDNWWSGELLDETRRETGRHVFPSNFVRLFR